MTLPIVRFAVAALLIGLAGAVRADVPPDLAHALAFRELAPVRAWLDERVGTPESDSASAWRARVALARIDAPETAADLIGAARAEHPDDPGLLLQQAAIELDAMDADGGRFARMREARAIGQTLDRVLELDPDHPEGLTAAISFHRDVPRIAGGREERVAPMMARLAAIDPARAAFLNYEAAERAGRLDEAAVALDEAMALDPLSRPEWRARRAALTARQGDVEAAIESLEALVEAHPGFAPAWWALGRWIAASEQPAARGIDVLDHYILMTRWPGDPSLAQALVELSTLKARTGDTEGARRAMEHARILDSSLVDGAGNAR